MLRWPSMLSAFRPRSAFPCTTLVIVLLWVYGFVVPHLLSFVCLHLRLNMEPWSCRHGWPVVSLSYGFALGAVLQTLCAVVVLHLSTWRWLVALTSLLSLAPLLFSSCLPESPRFHAAAGDTPSARASLASIAASNGVRVPRAARPRRVLEMVFAAGGETEELERKARTKARAMQERLGSFRDLFRAPLSRFSWPLLVVWVGVSVAYLWQLFLASALLSSERLSETCVSAADADPITIPAVGAWISPQECSGISQRVVTEVFMFVAVVDDFVSRGGARWCVHHQVAAVAARCLLVWWVDRGEIAAMRWLSFPVSS